MGHFWPFGVALGHLGNFGPVGPFFAIWANLGCSGLFWPFGHYGPFEPILTIFGPLGAILFIMDLLGYFGSPGPLWESVHNVKIEILRRRAIAR